MGIAGVLCIGMAIGHSVVGLLWVLPHVTREQFPNTPFGPSSMSVSMIYVMWFIVTIFAGAVGGILVTLAWAPDADPRIVVLRWIAGLWAAAAAMAAVVVVRRMTAVRNVLRSTARLPVPVLWVVVAVICWLAST